MVQKIIDLCKQAAELNYSLNFRNGNIIELPEKGKLIVSGDLHGHRKNYQKIIAFADLENNPDTHLILQEILHGGIKDEKGGCLSFQLFFEILDLKTRFPDRVHMIMGNHDTAIITDSDVMKAGREMNEALKNALKRCFGEDFQTVNDAIKEYLLSQPLAAKTAKGIWVSHSLPADRYISDFDLDVFDTELFPDDLLRPEPAYLLTWGRRHSDEKLTEFADALGVNIFILGHQKHEKGAKQAGKNAIILISEHNHGCLIAIDLAKMYTVEELLDRVISLASIEVKQDE